MNKHFKTIIQLLLIWGAEMAVVWVVYRYFFPLSPQVFEQRVNSLEVEQISSPLGVNSRYSPPAFNPNLHNSDSFPLFMTGTSQEQILAVLGEPEWRRKGYWENSIAWSYENMLSLNIDIGFLFDTRTKKLRQAEIALPPSIKLEALYGVLDGLLTYTPASIERKLEAVYWRETDSQTFTIHDLEAVIQRNDQDRIYIGVWEEDFH